MFTTLLLVSAAAVAAAPIYMIAGAAAEKEDDLPAPEAGEGSEDADREERPGDLLDIAFEGKDGDPAPTPAANSEAGQPAAPDVPAWARDGDVFDLDDPEGGAADALPEPPPGQDPPRPHDSIAGPGNAPGRWDNLVLSPETGDADRTADPLVTPDYPVLSAVDAGSADAPADPLSDAGGTTLSPETDENPDPLPPGAADTASAPALPAVNDFVQGRDMLEVTLVTPLAPKDVSLAIQPSADGLDSIITANDIPVATVEGVPDLTLDDLVVQYQAPLTPSQA